MLKIGKVVAVMAMAILLGLTAISCTSKSGTEAESPAAAEKPTMAAMPTAAVTPSPAPKPTLESTPSPSPAVSQAAPLMLCEIKESMSINAVVAKYGNYNSYTTSYSAADGGTHVCLRYDNHVIELSDYDQALSFAGNGNDGIPEVSLLAEADKTVVLDVSSIFWTNEQIIGIRDIRIGDSLEEVKAKFLDKASEYNDGHTIYTEMNDATYYFAEYFNRTTEDNTWLDFEIDPDYCLLYCTGYDYPGGYFENADFYFRNGTLIAMSHRIIVGI